MSDVLFRRFKKIFGQIVFSGSLLDPNLPCAGSFEAQRAHLTPKLRVFGVIWGQNPNIFKPRQIIYTKMKLLVP